MVINGFRRISVHLTWNKHYHYPAINYLFKVTNWNTRTMGKVKNVLFIVNFEQISDKCAN